jgi:hypothetical protein
VLAGAGPKWRFRLPKWHETRRKVIARNWQSAREGVKRLIVVEAKGSSFGITATLVSTATTQRLRQPIEAIGSALAGAFARQLPLLFWVLAV